MNASTQEKQPGDNTIDMEELKQIREEQQEMKKKYKSFLTTYNDKNVQLHDGDELKETSDIDMSFIFFLIINKKYY